MTTYITRAESPTTGRARWIVHRQPLDVDLGVQAIADRIAGPQARLGESYRLSVVYADDEADTTMPGVIILLWVSMTSGTPSALDQRAIAHAMALWLQVKWAMLMIVDSFSNEVKGRHVHRSTNGDD